MPFDYEVSAALLSEIWSALRVPVTPWSRRPPAKRLRNALRAHAVWGGSTFAPVLRAFYSVRQETMSLPPKHVPNYCNCLGCCPAQDLDGGLVVKATRQRFPRLLWPVWLPSA